MFDLDLKKTKVLHLYLWENLKCTHAAKRSGHSDLKTSIIRLFIFYLACSIYTVYISCKRNSNRNLSSHRGSFHFFSLIL